MRDISRRHFASALIALAVFAPAANAATAYSAARPALSTAATAGLPADGWPAAPGIYPPGTSTGRVGV